MMSAGENQFSLIRVASMTGGAAKTKFPLVVILMLAVASLSAAQNLKDSACLDCHAGKTLVKTNAAGRALPLFVDAAKLFRSVHSTNTCVSCHQDITAKQPDDEAISTRSQPKPWH